MNDLAARVMRLQAAAWSVRRAAPAPCGLPFALALMTDERRQADLVSMLERLPPAGASAPLLVVFRHHGLAPADRDAVMIAARQAAWRRGHLFVVAGGRRARAAGARAEGGSFGLVNDSAPPGGADGAHNAPSAGLVTASVHDLGEGAEKAVRLAPDLVFVSPVFPTESHPGAATLGPARASAIAGRLPAPSFALGGVDQLAARRLIGSAFQGIAAIGAFGG